MNPEEVPERLRESEGTELDRLGSDKAAFALTGGSLDPSALLRALAERDRAVAAVYSEWAADESESEVAEAFRAAADRAEDHAARSAAAADGDPDPGTGDGAGPASADAVTEYLRSLDGTEARIGAGLLARPLVHDRTLLQVLNVLINEADEERADLVREFRTDLETVRAEGTTLLSEQAGDAERALTAAAGLVEIAYEEYVDALEDLGMDPKPIC